MKRLTKHEMVLEIYDREAMGEVTAREIAIINQGLIEEYGEGGAMAPAEIARILVAEEIPVRFEQIFRMMTPTERYENLFDRLTEIESLRETEAAIRKIEELSKGFERQGDKTGMRYARRAAQTAKKNAEERSRSERLTEKERREQAEIARWITVWLQTPGLFSQWLELRKATKECSELLGENGGDGDGRATQTGSN